MTGYLIPPRIEVGQQITDDALLAELETLRGDGQAQKEFAQRIGPSHGMPDADFCLVSYLRGQRVRRHEICAQTVAHVAKYIEP